MVLASINADPIRIDRPATNSRLFAHTRWDAVPALAGLFHLAYFLGLFFLYPHAPLWVMLILGFTYSLMVNANINRNGHDGEAESPWRYVFLSFFRDDVGAIRRELRKRGNGDVFWGNLELAAFATALLIMFFFNWRYVIFFMVPFWYLGHCFSYLNGYYRHYGANPDKPIAWGVSSYGKIYNWLFFYNGYHAEHHFRPKVHWTKMEAFRQSIAELQKEEGVRTIKRAHMLGFLDPDLRKRGEGGGSAAPRAMSEQMAGSPPNF